MVIKDKLYRWVEANNFSGFDPYDGLNCSLLRDFPLLRKKFIMIFITQFFKIIPINLRPLFGIRKERNAKGISLFASALKNLYNSTKNKEYLNKAIELTEWLMKNKSPFTDYYAWGYNFPWQSRNAYKARNYPNVVTTSFVGNTFLDMYELTREKKYLDIAISASEFILNELNIYKDDRGICFSYSPSDNERVYNATLLASRHLIKTWKYSKNNKFLKQGLESVEFVLNSQNRDGSWVYGDFKNQQWIDNFHTGYNLWALKEINDIIKNDKIKESINIGFDYYLGNLFTKNMLPKYFNNKLYPLDIHAYAVAIIVFTLFGEDKLCRSVYDNVIDILYSGKGYFYFRKTKLWTIKIPYMRWSNAWMFYALSIMSKRYY
jgi:hypothetical protein